MTNARIHFDLIFQVAKFCKQGTTALFNQAFQPPRVDEHLSFFIIFLTGIFNCLLAFSAYVLASMGLFTRMQIWAG
jgi:hypothetical protein